MVAPITRQAIQVFQSTKIFLGLGSVVFFKVVYFAFIHLSVQDCSFLRKTKSSPDEPESYNDKEPHPQKNLPCIVYGFHHVPCRASAVAKNAPAENARQVLATTCLVVPPKWDADKTVRPRVIHVANQQSLLSSDVCIGFLLSILSIPCFCLYYI